MGARVLCLGSDPILLETRGLILGKYFEVFTADTIDLFDSFLTTRPSIL